MMGYIALAVLMVAAVLTLLVVRRIQVSAYSMQAANRDIYEARLKELEQEPVEGKISAAEYDAAVMELQKTFVADNADDDKPVRERPAGILLPMFILVGLSALMYFVVGDSWKLQRQADQAVAQLPELSQRIMGDSGQAAPSAGELEMFALGLRQRLEQRPDAGAWMLYGRVMMQMRQIEQAVEAFEKSLALEPNRTSTLITHSQALIMMGSDGDLARAARNIRRVLEEQPMHSEGLGLLGVIAYERGDYAQAQQAWQLTLQVLDPSDPRYTAIENSLIDVENRLSGETLYLTVTVDITDELRNEMPPFANVFVFVRDPDGSRAPAAVIRQPISDLPVTVTLTEEDAMVEGHTLATISRWLVSARLTTGDTIEIQPGVMEARPRLMTTESGQQINLTISEMY